MASRPRPKEFHGGRRERHWPFGRQNRGAVRLFDQRVPRQIPGWWRPQLFGYISVIKAYDAAITIPLVGAAFANRISYVISPEEGTFTPTPIPTR
jgi:hypothetical protein